MPPPSNVGVVWSPEFEQLKRRLREMAPAFAGEADHIAEDAATAASVAIKQEYSRHWVTGNLTKRVAVTRFTRGTLRPGWSVHSRAPHTWLFEHGSQPRHYVTQRGKVHRTGAMWHGAPPPPTFFPTVNRFRHLMESQLIAMVQRAGLAVTRVTL